MQFFQRPLVYSCLNLVTVDCNMCRFSKLLLFSFSSVRMAVIAWWNGPLPLVVIFFALCLLLLTWSIAGISRRACHSSGTFFIREVRWVRRDTRLTIRVTVWGRGLGGAKSQRVGRLRCRTQQGLSPAPERTGELAPLTPFYSIIVPVVQFFGRSSFLLWQSWLVHLRLT